MASRLLMNTTKKFELQLRSGVARGGGGGVGGQGRAIAPGRRPKGGAKMPGCLL